MPENIQKGVEIAGVIGTNQGVRYGKVLRRLVGGNTAMNISSYNAKYSSCGVTLMIPSDAEVVKVGFSKTMSYGASMSVKTPDWEAGSYPFSSYISGQYLVITASFAFVPSRSQEKHHLRGGVEYFEPIAPLYIDTTENAALGGLHVPVLSGSTFAGYMSDTFEKIQEIRLKDRQTQGITQQEEHDAIDAISQATNGLYHTHLRLSTLFLKFF